ncbi:TadE family protein [Vibrio sp. SCSIO 43136]|uniref:TadE/TadG family type IV pilus assembly protein n=1 Tax=Vibrio sp. SCSIO 43136 TaxID=2819101 RepID=UPI002075A702|nr:TadE family protein [Vibrio sp. SCSIO 43136]USD67750.1 pilus assembly protein [Vibrio sp. SCSIO 43136]
MKYLLKKKQTGVFAIEFALGFLVLFMFTMLIFETCRLTYICAVLDYTTAEAARDARVQLDSNPDFDLYKSDLFVCEDHDLSPTDLKQCQMIKSFKGDEYQVWFYSFLLNNGGKLWEVMTAKNDFAVTAKHYKTLTDLERDRPTNSRAAKDRKNWQDNGFSLFEVNYTYQPIFFKAKWSSVLIKRSVLIIDEFERHTHANK